jgi:hypothetical protein
MLGPRLDGDRSSRKVVVDLRLLRMEGGGEERALDGCGVALAFRPRSCPGHGAVFKGGLVASVAGVQPSVENSDGIIKLVGVADRDESPTAADSAGAGKGVERREGKLRLRERQLGLHTKPGVPARRSRLEPPRLLIERQ